MNPRMQIIRGLPGSGKTTLAIEEFPHLMRLETDMYFYRQGAYRFTLANNKRAVKWFLKAVRNFCNNGIDFVTTGVFCAHTERLSTAIETALSKGYEVYIKTLLTQYKSIHGVPKEHLDSMRMAFVSDRSLRKIYAKEQRVHFGLMGKGMELVHLRGE